MTHEAAVVVGGEADVLSEADLPPTRSRMRIGQKADKASASITAPPPAQVPARSARKSASYDADSLFAVARLVLLQIDKRHAVRYGNQSLPSLAK